MGILADKMRRARETRITHGVHEFVIRRPTEMEFAEWLRDRVPVRLLDYVVDWSGVRECDLVNGGDPHPVEFDRDALVEWATDNSTLFVALTSAVIKSREQYIAQQAAAVKN